MNCTTCALKKICKVEDLKRLYEGDIVFDITSCKFKHLNDNVSANGVQAIPAKEKNSFASSFNEEEYQRLLDKQNGVVNEIDTTLVTCSTCQHTDYKEYISVCSKCGTEICGNCGTSDNGLNYCQKCWEEL